MPSFSKTCRAVVDVAKETQPMYLCGNSQIIKILTVNVKRFSLPPEVNETLKIKIYLISAAVSTALTESSANKKQPDTLKISTELKATNSWRVWRLQQGDWLVVATPRKASREHGHQQSARIGNKTKLFTPQYSFVSLLRNRKSIFPMEKSIHLMLLVSDHSSVCKLFSILNHTLKGCTV